MAAANFAIMLEAAVWAGMGGLVASLIVISAELQARDGPTIHDRWLTLLLLMLLNIVGAGVIGAVLGPAAIERLNHDSDRIIACAAIGLAWRPVAQKLQEKWAKQAGVASATEAVDHVEA